MTAKNRLLERLRVLLTQRELAELVRNLDEYDRRAKAFKKLGCGACKTSRQTRRSNK
jgi:hypothetical protein